MQLASLIQRKPAKELKEDDHGYLHISGLMSAVLGLVFTLVGVVIVFRVGAAILPTILTAIADIVTAFNTGSVNDTTGNAILSISGLVISVVAVLGLLYLFIEASFGAVGGKGA